MPFRIVNKQVLAEGVKRVDIVAPNIARKILPGQFSSSAPKRKNGPSLAVDRRRTPALLRVPSHETGNQSPVQFVDQNGPLGEPAQETDGDLHLIVRARR